MKCQCKFWKVNGFATERLEGESFGDHKRREVAREEATDYLQEDTASDYFSQLEALEQEDYFLRLEMVYGL